MLFKSWCRSLLKKKTVQHFKNYTKLSYLHNPGSEPLRPLTLGKLLEETCHKHGKNLAIISCDQNKSLNFQEVLDEADRLAAGFFKLGFSLGDPVGIWAPNLTEWYVANMACARAGFVMVSLNPAYQAREIEYSLNKVGVKGILCGSTFKKRDFYGILKTICPELSECEAGKIRSNKIPSLKSVVMITDEILRGTHRYSDILNFADDNTLTLVKKNQDAIRIDDPCNMNFTSGTTGLPKAAVVSHFNIVNNGFYIGKRNELGKKHHRICVQNPFFHAFGTVIAISAALNYGSTLVIPSSSYDPEKNLDALKEKECTIIYGTPTMYVDLVNAQRRRKEKINAEIAVTGGASCSPALFKDMSNILGVRKVKSIYGLTETTASVFQSMEDDDELKTTSTVGYIQEHLEIKVVDKNDSIVPVGVPGELCVRGYNNMLGYWGDENKTKEIMGQDKWLRTGDQVILHENGYGSVIGRLKDMLIRGGENIYPKEIEDYLNTHPSILETQVIGLPHERLGEEVCACIRTKDNCQVTLEDIKDFCRGNIAHFKIPSVLKIVESFPKTASGKIQKFKLTEELINNKIC